MITASANGDEVWVAKGNYQRANSGEYFSMKEGVKIYGGFAGNEESLIQRDLTITANASILKGNGTYVVRSSSSITNTTVLDGFTITDGTMSGIYNIGASPTIKNCTIKNNTSTTNGGGIYNSAGASPVLINCSISNNTSATNGGGIYLSSGITITNCSFTGNNAAYGGAIHTSGAPSVLTNCSFTSNIASNGGGMYNSGGAPVLTNCSFANNTATFGGAMNNYFSSPKLRNCIVYGNSSGIANYNNSSPDIRYSLIQGLTSTDNGNISGDVDPLFVDPANGDYRLQRCSQVINKGSNTYYASDQDPNLSPITTDLDEEPRFYASGTVDMGAYEYQAAIATFAGVFYVKEGGTGTGTSWDCATGDLQAAINSAQSGDEVWVAKGNYKRANSGEYFSMKEGVEIYGGFAGNEESLTQRDLTITANASILKGNDSEVINNYFNNLSSATVLDGFTITGGTKGGIRNSSASPTIKNCNITGNIVIGNGGGIYINYDSTPILTNCNITGNTANSGGGIYNGVDCSTTLTNCSITDNVATDGTGAGMFNQTSEPWLTNCSIINNDGSALHNVEASAPRLRNSIIYGNSSGISNSISSPDIKYSLVQGIFSTNDGNISGDTDPLFVDAANGDYRLQACSPLINKGSNTYYASGQTPDLTAINTDLAGETRFYASGTVDIGAYEYQAATATFTGVFYVKAGGTGTGTSWDCPMGDLQVAINSAAGGQQVWVAKGTYQRANTGEWFSMKNNVKIYGGFNGDETSITQRNLTNPAHASVLQGNGTHVVYNNGDDIQASALLDGFTITGGSVEFGGGIRNNRASPTIKNCIITNNTVTFHGAGIYNASGSPVFINCIVRGNTAANIGGGIYNTITNARFTNCTITDNRASNSGGMYISGSSTATLTNCTIAGNTASNGIGGISNNSSTLTVRNSIVYGNSSGINAGDVSYSLIQGMTSTDNGNISGDADPLFVDPANGDYRLQPCSPVINKGSNMYYASGQTPDLTAITADLDGKARFYNNGVVDMGAYELEYNTAIIYVKEGGTGPGTSWDCATDDLQEAIN
jgi:parallel beta-helix repeat protein